MLILIISADNRNKRREVTIGGPDSSYAGKGPPVFRQPLYFHAGTKVGHFVVLSQFAQGLCRFARFLGSGHLCAGIILSRMA